jgi:hypothetical protein
MAAKHHRRSRGRPNPSAPTMTPPTRADFTRGEASSHQLAPRRQPVRILATPRPSSTPTPKTPCSPSRRAAGAVVRDDQSSPRRCRASIRSNPGSVCASTRATVSCPHRDPLHGRERTILPRGARRRRRPHDDPRAPQAPRHLRGPTGRTLPRELEILQLIAEGHSGRQIANQLTSSQKPSSDTAATCLPNEGSATASNSPATPFAAASSNPNPPAGTTRLSCNPTDASQPHPPTVERPGWRSR